MGASEETDRPESRPKNDFGRMNVLLEERSAPASRPVLRLRLEAD
jgi:hypothetical protein